MLIEIKGSNQVIVFPTTEKERKGLTFSISLVNLYYIVNGLGKCIDKNIVIPKKYKGTPVEAIDEFCFFNHIGLTSVTIGSSVETIDDGAFKNCSKLKSITIPHSVTSIGCEEFSNCSGLTSVTFENANGWWYARSSNATSGTSLDLSSTTENAIYLKDIHCLRYWKRS